MCVTVQLVDWVVFYPASIAHLVMPFVKEVQKVGQAQNFYIPEPKL